MKYMFKVAGSLVGIVSLAGCLGGGSGGSVPASQDITDSGFIQPTSGKFATIPVALRNELNEQIYVDGIGGAAYVVGTNDNGARAYAGIIPGSNPGDIVTNGSVVYDTTYEVLAIVDISVSGNTLTGRSGGFSGNMDLTADFDRNTLTGSDGFLTVDGVVNGGSVTGDVDLAGIAGDLRGVIGEDAVIGAFAGHDQSNVYSGGFVGLN